MEEKFLITGGCGMLGRALAGRLAGAGASVLVIDTIEEENPVEGVEYMKGDIRKPEHTDQVCDGVSTVFHLAAAPMDADPDTIRDINIDGTANLLQSAELTGVSSFIFASCCTVYGYPPEQLPCTEDTPLYSSGAFSLSKVIGEELCFEAMERAGIMASVIRSPVILGPRMKDDFITKWIVERAVENNPVFLPGTEKVKRHYVDVEDCAGAFVAAASTPEAAGMCFNVGYSRTHTDEQVARAVIKAARSFSITIPVPRAIVELAMRVMKMTDDEELLHPEMAGVLFNDYHYDTARARQILGWKPDKSLSVTMYEYMRWYRRRELKRERAQAPA